MIRVKPQESLATFPTVEKPTNLFSSEPFRKLLAPIYPLTWEKTQNLKCWLKTYPTDADQVRAAHQPESQSA